MLRRTLCPLLSRPTAKSTPFDAFLAHHERTFPIADAAARTAVLARMFAALPAAERQRFEARARGAAPTVDAGGSDGTADRRTPIDRSQVLAAPSLSADRQKFHGQAAASFIAEPSAASHDLTLASMQTSSSTATLPASARRSPQLSTASTTQE